MNLKDNLIQRLACMASHYENMEGFQQALTLRQAIGLLDESRNDAEVNRLKRKCKSLEASLRLLSKDLIALTEESTGVAGWHLNGDIANWDEFEGMMRIARGAL